MKIASLFESARLNFDVHGDWKQRVFFDASLKDEHRTWLDLPGKKLDRGSATVDITPEYAYINRIDATPTGKGFGSELLKEIIRQIKEHNIKRIETYIEHTNVDSKSMFKKAGFKELKKNKDGSTWGIEL
jgi:RimJ/RimL family protein N-acetyltransferase